MKIENSNVIADLCSRIAAGNLGQAESFIKDAYPFVPITKVSRTYTPRQMTKVFLRDGFIDRYKGTRLVYPPVLRVISTYLPEAFPYHKNGKMDVGHIAYWELFPTIDHIVPVGRGGGNSEGNWVCCSMLSNSIKSNWTLEQLDWELLPAGNLANWDGMIHWFIEQVQRDMSLLEVPYIKTWFRAAKELIQETL